MPPSKKILLQTRLQKRAYRLGFPSIHEYVEFLFSPRGQNVELDHFAGIVSTHKTELFREPDHFIALRNKILPEIVNKKQLSGNEPLLSWSAASSTGEEVYSMAITMYDFFKTRGNSLPLIKVFGTDISDDIVEFAKKGIYASQALSTVPVEYRHYFMRSKDPKQQKIRVVPELRKYTEFHRQNLMDTHYNIKMELHIIFCRNVLIYFDRTTQEMILRKLVNQLVPGGFLFIGHSESLSGMNLPVESVQMTIYRKTRC